MLVTPAAVLLFAVGGATILLQAADPAGPVRDASGGTPTLQSLAAAGGGTDVFRVAVAFTGTFLFVVFVGVTAAEFSRGTIRTMLLRQPLRARLLAGKLAALLTYAAVTLAATEALTWVAARAGLVRRCRASAWTSLRAGRSLSDYGVVLLWISGYAVLGMALGVLVRSVPVALAVGIAGRAVRAPGAERWSPAGRWFPASSWRPSPPGHDGRDRARPGHLATYIPIAAGVAIVVFDRRDVA